MLLSVTATHAALILHFILFSFDPCSLLYLVFLCISFLMSLFPVLHLFSLQPFPFDISCLMYPSFNLLWQGMHLWHYMSPILHLCIDDLSFDRGRKWIQIQVTTFNPSTHSHLPYYMVHVIFILDFTYFFLYLYSCILLLSMLLELILQPFTSLTLTCILF